MLTSSQSINKTTKINLCYSISIKINRFSLNNLTQVEETRKTH